MTARQKTFEFLDCLKVGQEFSGAQLHSYVCSCCGFKYHDTLLRYMRDYRKKAGIDIVNIDKRKSKYKVLESYA